MITGFEEYTDKLTDDERRMIGPMCAGLVKHVGKENAITSSKMIEGMRGHGFKLDGPRLRKVMNVIRITRRVKNIVATSNGYYVARTQQELDLYKQSLDERISSIQALRDSYND